MLVMVELEVLLTVALVSCRGSDSENSADSQRSRKLRVLISLPFRELITAAAISYK